MNTNSNYKEKPNLKKETTGLIIFSLYKATLIGFYPMEKIDDDFYYLGKTSFFTSNNNGVVAAGAAMFGLIGAIAASSATVNIDLFQYKINYLKGNSVPVYKIIIKE